MILQGWRMIQVTQAKGIAAGEHCIHQAMQGRQADPGGRAGGARGCPGAPAGALAAANADAEGTGEASR